MCSNYLGISFLYFLACFIGIFLVEKLGRRNLLLFSLGQFLLCTYCTVYTLHCTRLNQVGETFFAYPQISSRTLYILYSVYFTLYKNKQGRRNLPILSLGQFLICTYCTVYTLHCLRINKVGETFFSYPRSVPFMYILYRYTLYIVQESVLAHCTLYIGHVQCTLHVQF